MAEASNVALTAALSNALHDKFSGHLQSHDFSYSALAAQDLAALREAVLSVIRGTRVEGGG